VNKLVGSEHILFGSDYPLLPQNRFLKEIESLDLSQETKDLILSGNACRLLQINDKG
jgi:predicted TIM-barrel fold metal-dependent hydrolase